jgi:hypothetical protein
MQESVADEATVSQTPSRTHQFNVDSFQRGQPLPKLSESQQIRSILPPAFAICLDEGIRTIVSENQNALAGTPGGTTTTL